MLIEVSISIDMARRAVFFEQFIEVLSRQKVVEDIKGERNTYTNEKSATFMELTNNVHYRGKSPDAVFPLPKTTFDDFLILYLYFLHLQGDEFFVVSKSRINL